ncbi:hypothetical protein B0H17DRAFT_1039911 [Mycena rosella]|uniref:Uncharacterized protein n=1 Tax=Mycena rosella TaxID=1033263 RepID=A0AAD7M7G1_MYCRO|nr:hypothetical protein B0H17DRAFT_1039911 [Mycena rosella]
MHSRSLSTSVPSPYLLAAMLTPTLCGYKYRATDVFLTKYHPLLINVLIPMPTPLTVLCRLRSAILVATDVTLSPAPPRPPSSPPGSLSPFCACELHADSMLDGSP